MKSVQINDLYRSLIKFPLTTKVYRDLKSYYQSVGKINEAEAFQLLLREEFGEIVDVNLPDNH